MERRGAALRPRPGAPPSSPRAPLPGELPRLQAGRGAGGEHSPWRSSSPWRAQHLDAHGRRPCNRDRATAPVWMVFSEALPRPKGPAVSPCGLKPGPLVAAGELSSSSGFPGLGTLSCRHKSLLGERKRGVFVKAKLQQRLEDQDRLLQRIPLALQCAWLLLLFCGGASLHVHAPDSAPSRHSSHRHVARCCSRQLLGDVAGGCKAGAPLPATSARHAQLPLRMGKLGLGSAVQERPRHVANECHEGAGAECCRRQQRR